MKVLVERLMPSFFAFQRKNSVYPRKPVERLLNQNRKGMMFDAITSKY